MCCLCLTLVLYSVKSNLQIHLSCLLSMLASHIAIIWGHIAELRLLHSVCIISQIPLMQLDLVEYLC